MKRNNDAKTTYGLEMQAAAKKYWDNMSTGERVLDVISSIFTVVAMFVGVVVIETKIIEASYDLTDRLMTRFMRKPAELDDSEQDLDSYSH